MEGKWKVTGFNANDIEMNDLKVNYVVPRYFVMCGIVKRKCGRGTPQETAVQKTVRKASQHPFLGNGNAQPFWMALGSFA